MRGRACTLVEQRFQCALQRAPATSRGSAALVEIEDVRRFQLYLAATGTSIPKPQPPPTP